MKGMLVARVLVWVAIVAVVVAGFLLAKRDPSARGALQLTAIVVVTALLARSSWQQRRLVLLQPPIHDISTDLVDPPAFVAIAPLRREAAYDGPAVAEAQRRAYPEIQPLQLTLSPADAFARAVTICETMGWTLVAADAAEGRIEATATTFLMGFKDDVVLRIRAADGGSRVDIRSKSRVGKSDLGANAARIRTVAARLQAAR